MPLVSVIIPARNPGSYLRDALKSVVGQTLSDWRVCVIDDGSTEDLSWVQQEFPMVELVRQPQKGLSIARNVGILNSTSEFIAFLDADDLWAPTKLERQLELMKMESDVAMCYTGYEVIDTNGQFVRAGLMEETTSYRELLRFSGIRPSTVMLRRSCLAQSGLFDPLLVSIQDLDLWLKIARQTKIKYIPSCEVSYRIHESNMSKKLDQHYLEMQQVLKMHVFLASQTGDLESLESARKGMSTYRSWHGAEVFELCRRSVRQGDSKSFFKYFFRSFALDPGLVLSSLVCWAKKRLVSRASSGAP